MFVLMVLSPSVWAENLIDNPSFEKHRAPDRFGRPFEWWGGWSFDPGAKFGVGKVARTGTASCLLDAGPGQKIRMTTPAIKISPGRYRLTAYFRGLDVAPGSTDTSIDLFIPQGNRHFNLRRYGTFGWSKMTYVFEQPLELSNVEFHFGLLAGGRLWIDDVSLEAVDTSVELSKLPTWSPEEAPIDPAGPLGENPKRCMTCLTRNPVTAAACFACGEGFEEKAADPSGDSIVPMFALDGPQAVRFGIAHGGVIKGYAGQPALRVDKSYATLDAPQDWSRHDYVHFDVFNPGAEPAGVDIEMRDRATTDYWTRVNLSTVVAPGKSTVTLPTRLYVGEKSRPGRGLIRDAITRFVVNVGDRGPLEFSNFRFERVDPSAHTFPELLAFDAGPAGQNVMEGFTPLGPGVAYTSVRGFGWEKARIWRAIDALQPESLTRDFLCVESGTLRIDAPDGVYRVHMNIESPGGYWGELPRYRVRRITANGQLVHERKFDAASYVQWIYRHAMNEDLPGEDAFSQYVTQVRNWVTFDVKAQDGAIKIGFEGLTDAIALSAFVMYPVSKAEQGKSFLDWVTQRRRAQYEMAFKQMIPPRRGQAAPDAGLRLFKRDTLDLPRAYDGPEANQILSANSELAVTVAKGEESALVVCVQSGENAEQLQATLAPLKDGTKTLAGDAVVVGWLDHRFHRDTMDGSVFSSRPRYWHPMPAPNRKGITRPIWMRVRVPSDAPHGEFRSTLKVRAGTASASVPVKITVLPFALDPITDVAVGPWSVTMDVPWFRDDPATRERNWSMYIKSLQALRDVGCTSFSGIPNLRVTAKDGKVTLDTTVADREMKAARDAGFRHVVSSYGIRDLAYNLYGNATGPDMDAVKRNGFADFQSMIATIYGQIDQHALKNGWLPVAWNLCDEPLGKGPIDAAVKNAQAHRAIVSGLSRTTFMGATSTNGKDDHADLAMALPMPSLNGHEATSLDALRAAGNSISYYNSADRWTMGRYMRMMVRKHEMKLRLVWHYHAAAGDPYNALDCREDDYSWFNTNAQGDMIPSVDLLVHVQPGLNDYRYLATLDRLLAEKPNANSPAVEAARKIAAEVTSLVAGPDKVRGGDRKKVRSSEAYNAERDQVRQAIMGLLDKP